MKYLGQISHLTGQLCLFQTMGLRGQVKPLKIAILYPLGATKYKKLGLDGEICIKIPQNADLNGNLRISMGAIKSPSRHLKIAFQK